MLSEILMEQRKKKGVTQQEVSEYLHISRQSISNWETGKNYPDVPTLITLSEYYEFSLDILKNEDKVKEEYVRSFARKEKFKYQTIAIVLLVVMFTPIAGIQFTQNDQIAKWLVILMISVSVPLTVVSYKMTQLFYQGIIDKHSPLFVPKVFGFGITINPYHKLSKIIYFSIVGLLIILIIFTIQAPASSINR